MVSSQKVAISTEGNKGDKQFLRATFKFIKIAFDNFSFDLKILKIELSVSVSVFCTWPRYRSERDK